MREGCACAGQDNAGLLAQGDDALCAALLVEGDEIAALGVRPVGNAQICQLLFQGVFDDLELRRDECLVLLHVFYQVLELAAEEPQVTQLVHLVIADGGEAQRLLQICQVVLAGCDHGDAGARVGDLGGRGEHVADILVTGLLCLLQQVCLYRRIVYQVVYAVGVVPENTEILCLRLQGSKALYNLVAVYHAARIGVHGHAPDRLDGVVFSHQLFYHVHVRAVLLHGDVHQLHAQKFADGKVAVIARHRTEHLHLVILAPGLTAHDAVGHRQGHRPVHDVQAGVAANDNILRLYAQHGSEKRLCLRQAVQTAVVPAVQAVFCLIVILGQAGRDAVGQIQLLRRGLSPGHIQLQTLCLKCLILLFAVCGECFQCFSIHLCYSHDFSPGPHSADSAPFC